MEVIVIKDLLYSYNEVFTLRDVNLEISDGEMAAILGPNGSGKTTLLKLIFNILKPDGGCIFIDGTNTSELQPSFLSKLIGGVPQEHSPIFPFRTIDVVVMGKTPYLDMFSAPSTKDYEDAYEVLRQLKIEHLASKPYTQLSGGERRLVLIARALMQKPKILLLDEPTIHLDIRNKLMILNIIKRLSRDGKLTIVMTTHDPNEALNYSDKIILMNNGRIVFVGDPSEVHAKTLEEIYRIPIKILDWENRRLVIPLSNKI